MALARLLLTVATGSLAFLYIAASLLDGARSNREQVNHWCEKWAQADDSADTLLRHSNAPHAPAETLLRPSKGETQTPSDQLLRAAGRQK